MEIAIIIRDTIFKWVGIWWCANRLTDVVWYIRDCWTARRAERQADYEDAKCEPVETAEAVTPDSVSDSNTEDGEDAETPGVSAWKEDEE